jgi:hypothetical protein
MPTPNTLLEYFLETQANAHVKINTALAVIDSVMQLSVVNRTTTTPPTASDGSVYLIPSGASSPWDTRTNQLAIRVLGSWRYLTPWEGMVAYLKDEDIFIVWNGVRWTPCGSATLSLTKTSDQNSLTSTWVDVTWETQAQINSGLFTVSSADITLKDVGKYLVHAKAGFTATSGTTAWNQARAKLTLNGSDVTGAVAVTNVSQTNAPGSTANLSMIVVTSSANETLRLAVQRTSGSSTVNLEADWTNLTVQKI